MHSMIIIPIKFTPRINEDTLLLHSFNKLIDT